MKLNPIKVAKFFLLGFWIVVTALFGIWAAYGNTLLTVNNTVAEYLFELRVEKVINSNQYLSPVEYLTLYNSKYDHPAPIDLVMDAIMKKPNWSDALFDNDRYTKESANRLKNQYFALFEKIRISLMQYVNSKDSESLNKKLSFSVPQSLYSGTVLIDVSLPSQVITWIKEEKDRRLIVQNRMIYADIILLMIFLGAFGSIVYLIKDFNNKQADTSISVYFTQPFLGSFLAFAIFIIFGLAHTTLSTADVSKMRGELLYILSFAAGLLSEHAYQIIAEKTKNALSKLSGVQFNK